MTHQPLTEPELSNRMVALAQDLNGLHARDVLAVAGFLTAQAFRCWPPDERIAEAEHWCHTRRLMPATLFDMAAVADPGFARSEAICLQLEAMLRPLDDHPSVVITVIATLLTALLAECPPQHRARMTESVLDDIRSGVLEADGPHAA